MSSLRRAILAVLLGVAACSHEDAFGIRTPANAGQPLVPATPARLTYNPSPDTQPSWLPGDSIFLYTAYRMDHDSDGCLELLPSSGGQALRSICEPHPVGNDSTYALQSGAVSTGGQLAYLRSAKGPLNKFWTLQILEVRPLNDTAPPRAIATLPQAGLVPPHNGATNIAWLDDHRFVYRADQYQAVFCLGCIPYDSAYGLFVNLVDLSTATPTITTLPGTTNAYSVAVQDADHVLMTFPGDTHIYALTVSSGTLAPLLDFAPNYPGEIAFAAGRLAVVNSRLWTVDLPGGTVNMVDTLFGWGNPVLSSDGKRLVAHRGGDLWLYHLP